MKLLKLILCFAFVGLAFSCNTDDEVTINEIIGVWNLKSIESFGVDTPVTGCRLSDTFTFNLDLTGNNFFPENDPGDPCVFETVDFTWLRDGDQLMLDSVQEGPILIQIVRLTDVELQFSILEIDGVLPTAAEIRLFKYEK